MPELNTYYTGEPFTPREGTRCAVALDTSSGIPYDFLIAQLCTIKEKFSGLKNFEILLYSFEIRVYGPTRYTPANLENITNFECHISGGTCFYPIYNTMVESGADTFVMFTDGYFAEPVRDVVDPRLNIFLVGHEYGSVNWLPTCSITYCDFT